MHAVSFGTARVRRFRAGHRFSSTILLTLLAMLAPASRGLAGPASSIPDRLSGEPTEADPAFVSADLVVSRLDDLETLVRKDTAGDIRRWLEPPADGDCVDGLVMLGGGVNPDYGATFDGVVQRARLVLLGRIEASRPGFLHGIPGTMLRVRSDRVFKAPGNEPRPVSFVFLPVGEFSVGTARLCKRDSRFPPVPEVGRRVIVISHSATQAELVGHSEIADEELLVVSEEGEVHLPWRMADSGDRLSLDELLRRLEAGVASARPAEP